MARIRIIPLMGIILAFLVLLTGYNFLTTLKKLLRERSKEVVLEA